MRRILFVDDEQNILDGLRKALYRQRAHWEMVFALGSEAALRELEKSPFDVIVTDIRMPGMDGPMLLEQVKKLYPTVTRIILSGHNDREAMLRAIPVSHQFLSKPSDAQVLRETVERACELQALLRDDAIRRVVGKLDKLPSVPSTYSELTKVVGDPRCSTADIAKVVLRDPAMSVKILQLANSSYFGIGRRVTSIEQAVGYLGGETLKALVLGAHTFATMEVASVEGFSIDRLQRDSLLCARLAKSFLSDPKRAEEAFTAGLVHDIGKLIVALGSPAQFRDIVREVRATGRNFHVVEKEILQATHAEIGAYLLGVWGLPFSVVEAVAFHHVPGLVPEGKRDVLAAVHVADALADAGTAAQGVAEHGQDQHACEDKLDHAFLEAAGFAAESARWREIAAKELSKVGRS